VLRHYHTIKGSCRCGTFTEMVKAVYATVLVSQAARKTALKFMPIQKKKRSSYTENQKARSPKRYDRTPSLMGTISHQEYSELHCMPTYRIAHYGELQRLDRDYRVPRGRKKGKVPQKTQKPKKPKTITDQKIKRKIKKQKKKRSNNCNLKLFNCYQPFSFIDSNIKTDATLSIIVL